MSWFLDIYTLYIVFIYTSFHIELTIKYTVYAFMTNTTHMKNICIWYIVLMLHIFYILFRVISRTNRIFVEKSAFSHLDCNIFCEMFVCCMLLRYQQSCSTSKCNLENFSSPSGLEHSILCHFRFETVQKHEISK